MEAQILRLTSEIYDKLTNEENKEYDLNEFNITQDEIKYFLKDQKALLMEFLTLHGDNKELSFKKCREFYQNIEIPYIIIDNYIKLLKKQLLREILSLSFSADVILGVEHTFDEMLNLVANVYIKKKISENSYINYSKFDKFPLYNVHIDWAKKIFDAIINEDFLLYPHKGYDECIFTEMMQYPESLMVCMDATLCGQLELLHKIIHNNSEALYRLIIAKEYTQALFILKEFSENLQKFFSLLKDLYHVTYTDLERSFFQLIEMLEYSDSRITISVFDI